MVWLKARDNFLYWSSCLKKYYYFKSGQKWLQNNYLTKFNPNLWHTLQKPSKTTILQLYVVFYDLKQKIYDKMWKRRKKGGKLSRVKMPWTTKVVIFWKLKNKVMVSMTYIGTVYSIIIFLRSFQHKHTTEYSSCGVWIAQDWNSQNFICKFVRFFCNFGT